MGPPISKPANNTTVFEFVNKSKDSESSKIAVNGMSKEKDVSESESKYEIQSNEEGYDIKNNISTDVSSPVITDSETDSGGISLFQSLKLTEDSESYDNGDGMLHKSVSFNSNSL
jgi:hypothetical protein